MIIKHKSFNCKKLRIKKTREHKLGEKNQKGFWTCCIARFIIDEGGMNKILLESLNKKVYFEHVLKYTHLLVWLELSEKVTLAEHTFSAL